MRQVKVFEWKQVDGQFRKVEKEHATFHQFGCNYQEYESGPGNFSTAIVEYADGTVDNVPVELIQFI